MEILTPVIHIKIDVIDMTPSEAASIGEICGDLDIKTEWCEPNQRGRISMIAYFDNQKKADRFLSICAGMN